MTDQTKQTTQTNPSGRASRTRVRTLVQLALLTALELVLAYTPLGYLPVGPLHLSFLTVPVAIGAMTIGPAAGALLGGVFGFTSFFNAMGGTSAMGGAMFAVNPFFCFLTCVGARILCGFLTGWVFRAVRRALPHKQKTCCVVGGLCAPVFNTAFFMGALVLFYYGTDYVQGLVRSLGAANPFVFVLALVGVQGAIEAAVCCAVSAAVCVPLLRYLEKNRAAA